MMVFAASPWGRPLNRQLTFHIRVRRLSALAAASPERIRVVDAGADVEIVQARILAEVLACLEGQQQGGLL